MIASNDIGIAGANTPTMFVHTLEDIDRYQRLVRKAAEDARAWITEQTGDPLVMLRRMKFGATSESDSAGML